MRKNIISDANHSSASREYANWCDRWAYLKANGYTDKNSIEMMCEDVGITIDVHNEWCCRIELDRLEARYPNM